MANPDFAFGPTDDTATALTERNLQITPICYALERDPASFGEAPKPVTYMLG